MIMTIAILLAVFGMMLATYIHLSKLNAEKNNVAITTKSFASVMNKMSLYMAAEGHLPCPAARNLDPASNQYGAETNCADVSVTPNASCAVTQPYCVTQRDGQRIRIGIVPFKTLKLSKEDAMDAYGNFFLYAVTESQTSTGSFKMEDGGKILLQKKNEAGTVTASRDAHFVLVSHGKDRRGAFSMFGRQDAACSTGQVDSENCNNDATFVMAPYAPANTTAHYDDRVEANMLDWVYIWDSSFKSQVGSYSRGPLSSFIGVGTEDPKEKLHVGGSNGNLRIENGALYVRRLCNKGSSSLCFPATVLGGDINSGKANHGMKCPADTVMIGISNNAPVCGTLAVVTSHGCPTDSFYAGVHFSGSGLIISCANAISGAISSSPLQ